ncbi:hypothetical protein [Streptomyces sp. enrichment culture]|uniref:hypothetical protein n=1 Tax=Streptomyces sp. enrichment culture TaxID=1795815 RepID=UPI003F570604
MALVVVVPLVLIVVRMVTEEDEVPDARPPFARDEVVAVTTKPDGFVSDIDMHGHWRAAREGDPPWLAQVKDSVFEDFFPLLGDPDARVTVECPKADFSDESKFQCEARSRSASKSDRNLRTTYDVALGRTGYDKNTGGQSVPYKVTARKVPLFRADVYQLLWKKKYPFTRELACTRMPAVTMVTPGSRTKYRCYTKDVGEEDAHWNTFEVYMEEGDKYKNGAVLAYPQETTGAR